ncbi:ABC transporter substrate-binding protein [Lacrimispora defluvii]|uniref:Sugar ABC transporter substrate-binding protein n=1 Tax=Lacrimispora defluvii TaxID=2719233 RepID=A0ABX1VS49_9FIRM|nr:sugar ABC transporter substrate-binding protein [Lacrimispora defluvii]NNJ30230.1 sugar ABC transporter substrate-binding protein [Lacrimispora defluvii]
MKKRRLLSGLLAAVMAVGMITGCSGGSSASSGKSGGNEKVTIKVALWDYSNTKYYKAIFDAFTAKYPDITVEPVEFAADEYDNTITTQLGGKQDFDVVFTKGTPALSALITQGHVLALDDFMAKDTSFNKDNYLGLMDQLQMDGKTYAVPFRKDNNMIFYNKDLFDKAGVPYPEDGMTMKEYHELAAKMTSGTGNDKVYGAHVHTWPSNVYNYARRIESFDQLNKDTYMNLKPYYEEILAMQDEGLVQDYGALKSSNIHYSGVFYNQQAAMLQIGTWYINMCLENVKDFKWGCCSIPNEEGIGNTNAVGGVTPIAIGAYAKHPEEAWKFITTVCGEEGAELLANSGIVPGYNSEKINAIFDAIPEKYPNAPEKLSKYINVGKYVIEQRMDKHTKDIDNIITEQHSAIMTKSVTVDEGLKKLIERVSEVQAQ